MTEKKLSGNGKRLAKLTWTHDMRLTLDTLTQIDGLTWATRATIFNTIYSDEIKKGGYVDPLPYRTLRCQCSRTERTKRKYWIEIASPHQTAEELAKRRSLRSKVEETLAALSEGNGDGESISPSTSRSFGEVRATTPRPTQQVPLSERTPIALWYSHASLMEAADATPVPQRQRLRERARPSYDFEMSADDAYDSTSTTPTKRRRVVGYHPRPSTNILRSSQLDLERSSTARPASSTPSQALSPPGTPCAPSSKSVNKSPYPRPDDALRGCEPLALTEAQYATTRQRLVPVTEEQAHPSLPGLCFRYWRADPGQIRDSETGFKARIFELAVPVDDDRVPPSAKEVYWTDIINHVNKNAIATPYISVSVAFWWILRLALKEAKNGIKNGRLSIIDTSRLDKAAIFHVLPYHTELKKKKVWRDGAWNYPGTFERLVWREIHGNAIIKTIKISDLLRFASTDGVIGQALAFDLLPQRGGYEKMVLPALRGREVQISSEIVAGMARLVALLGLGTAGMDQLTHLVADIIQGWAIQLSKLTSAQWARHAATFEANLHRFPATELGLRSQEAKLGFLDGIKWAAAKGARQWHSVTRQSPVLMARLQKQAKLIGLEDPVKILTDELDAAKVRLRMLGARQRRLLQGGVGQAHDEDDGEGEGDEIDGVESEADPEGDENRNYGSDEEIIYE